MPWASALVPNKETREKMAQAIKKLREANRMTQHQLAKEAGVPQGTVARAELGFRSLPSESLPAICQALHITPDRLLGFSEAPSIDPETEATMRLVDGLQPEFRRAANDAIRGLVDGLTKAQGGGR